MDILFCSTSEVNGVDMFTSMTVTGIMPLHSHSRVDRLCGEQFVNDGSTETGIVLLGLSVNKKDQPHNECDSQSIWQSGMI